jgi:glutamate-1-semialdehyde aminotransferase
MTYSREELLAASGPALYRRAKELIPGGTQLLSKRPEMFAPDYWPAYYSRAKGCRVWDLDGREFIDMSIMGVGACVLGYADDEVDEAVTRVIRDGVASTLNCPEEVELAEVLLDLHPWFDRVRYARSGGEAMAIAVRIARASTRRDVVLFSGYHGWSDWYLAANLSENDALDGHLLPGLQPSGVPRGLIGTALPFPANDTGAFDELVGGREGSIAAIFIEPARGEEAPPGFLAHLREKASEIGAVLIFDEITSGFRMCAGSMHRRFDAKPDVAVLAKSMANGYAMSAVMGTATVMDAAQGTFVSSTNWTERIGPTAALATVRKYVREDVQDHLTAVGQHFRKSLISALPEGWGVSFSGIPSLVAYRVADHEGRAVEAELSVALLEAGYLAYPQFKPSAAHGFAIIDNFMDALTSAIGRLELMTTGSVPARHRGFQRLTAE